MLRAHDRMLRWMRTTSSSSATDLPTSDLRAVLIAGGLIVMVAMGIRQSFGPYLAPVSEGLGTGRETFSLAERESS